MSTSSVGDLSLSYMSRQRNNAIKQDIARLTEELTTGQTADVRNEVVGNYSFLSDLEHKTDMLRGYEIATTEATQFTGAMQLALEEFGQQVGTLSSALVSAGISPSDSSAQELATQAKDVFGGLISTLNTSSAGRQLFSGNTTNQRPMVDADTILADLTAAISSATTPADMVTQATTWFDDPAGFLASAYQGSADPTASFTLSERQNVDLDVRASDPSFFAGLRGAAVAALATDPVFALTTTDQAELFGLMSNELLQGESGVITLQSRVGFAEARIEAIATRNAAEVTSLQLARNAMLEVDPFEAATKLEEAQFQLQSLYSVTVRMSQLSLVNFL